MEQILNDYYANGAKKLHGVVNQIVFRKYGGVIDEDMDEFYSVANDVFSDIVLNSRYDPSKGNFDGFLYGALKLAIIDEIKRQNRDKRTSKIEVEIDGEKKKLSIKDVRLDAPIGDDKNTTVGDMIQSELDMNAALSEMDDTDNDKVKKYLNNLSDIQRQIVEMKMKEIPSGEIKKKLGLTNKKYDKYCQALKAFENIRVLFSENIINQGDDLEMSSTQTMENCKTDKISIASIIKRIDRHTIRFDHPLQRASDQWSPSMKGNFVSDILQGNKFHPLIFAEQIINDVPIIWDLDGKQRATNAYSYSKDGYKVSKNIRRWMIKYQTTEKDENGNDILDRNGFPIAVNAEFDIRGKRFSDLPEELQDRFLDYNFNYDQYLNCSEEDIGYHIERYNDGKPMTASQKGLTKLGTEYAEMVKSISNMSFFKDLGGYRVSEFKNGVINRVVVESVMASDFLSDWKKKQEEMCEYLKNNAESTNFDDFEDMVERLEKVVTDDVANMFNSRDSFLWFGLFARFVNCETDDKKFVEFMTEFGRSLHSKKIDGVSFDDLNGKSTKDKGVVIGKMNHLEKMMYEFLHIRMEDLKEINTLEFVKENVSTDITEEDVEQYEEVLDDLTLMVDNSSNLMDKRNRTPLLAVVAYSFINDIDLDHWIVDFFNRNNTYIRNCKENYSYMINDLSNFILKKNEISA